MPCDIEFKSIVTLLLTFYRYFAVNFYLFFQFAILSPRLTFSPENLKTIFFIYHVQTP